MEKSSAHNDTMPSAPPAYDEEFKPPSSNPPPYFPAPPVNAGLQTAPSATPPYPQQQYAAPPVRPLGASPAPVVQQPISIVQREVVVIGNVPVGPNQLTLMCPYCHKNVKTSTATTTHCSAHLVCLLLCMVGCWCCSCLPYCMNSFHSVHHTCPSCKAHLGTYQKL